MKRVLALLMTFCLCIGMAGCVGEKKTAGTDGEPYNIVWYMFGPEKPGLAAVNEEMSKYTMEKIGCTVELINVPTDYSSKMRLLIAGGEQFDIMYTSDADGFYDFASQGAFLELGDLLDKHGKGIKEILPEYFYPSATINGKLYAIPAYKDSSWESVLSYRLNMADKYNFKPEEIKEIGDLEPYLAAFKKDYPDSYPFALTGYVWRYPFATLGYVPVSNNRSLCMYTDMNGDETKIVNPFETEEVMEYLKMLYEWYKKGYIQKDVATASSYPEPYFFVGSEELPYQTEIANKTLPDDQKMGIVHWTVPVMNSTGTSMNAISRTSKNPEKAMEFLNLLNTDPYLKNLVTFGIEGKHFVKTDDTHYKLPDGMEAADLDYSSYQYTIGNRYITYNVEGSPDDILEKYKEYDATSYKSPTLGFYIDNKGVTTEIAAINNVYQEYAKSLLTGSVDPEKYLPEFLNKLKVAGYDKVLNEVQKQFDEWRKSNK